LRTSESSSGKFALSSSGKTMLRNLKRRPVSCWLFQWKKN
jgi:hypothetical protein